MARKCIKCGIEKPATAFNRRGNSYRGECRVCHNARRLVWAKANSEKRAESIHRHYAKRRGLNLEDCRRKPAVSREERLEKKRQEYQRDRTDYLRRAKKRAAAKVTEISEYNKEWRAQNRDRKQALDRAWRQANAHKVNAYAGSRNTRKRQSMPSWLTAIQLAQIQEFYEIARARTVQTGIEHHVDHIHPLKGIGFSGLHVPWNLQVMIGAENQSKGRRLPLAG